MTKSHAAGRDSEEPTPAQLKELFAQIESGRVNKGRMQEFLRGSTQAVTTEIAQEVMGKNFFGLNEWKRFFGRKVQIATVPEIPWSQSELENPEINQEYFLFLGLDCLDGKPLNLLTWHKVYSGENHCKFFHDWYLTNDFAKKTCGLRWYFMPVGIVKGSNNLTVDQQGAMLPSHYEVPSAIERISANVIYYLINRKYLDPDYWACTNDKSDSGDHVTVQGDSDGWFIVTRWSDDARGSIGVSASRKF